MEKQRNLPIILIHLLPPTHPSPGISPVEKFISRDSLNWSDAEAT